MAQSFGKGKPGLKLLGLSRGFWVALALVLIAAAAVFGWVVLARRATPDESLYVPKQTAVTPELELLREYVKIDTTNPPGNETEGAKFLIEQLRRNGISAELIESAPGRGNVYARIRGKRPGEGLLLLHHIDVVAADGEAWSQPPFAGNVDLNMMYGRGTLDMKGVGITQLLAFIDLAKSGSTPERDVVFLATADEEQGSRMGLEWLLEHRPDVIEGVRFAVNEGGITETIREEVVYFAVEVGSKQMVWLELHAPEREILRRVRLDLEPEFTSRDPHRVLPEVDEYFRAIAPKRLAYAEYLEDIEGTIEQGDFWRLPEAYRALTRNDLVMDGPTPAEGGGYKSDLYLLNLPDVEPEEAIAQIRQRLAPYGVTIIERQRMGPAAISSTQTRLFELIEECVKREYGDQVAVGPMLMPSGTTDSRYLRGRGVDVYGVWPFPVDFHQSQGIHGIDERVRLDWFMNGVTVMKELVRRYAGVDTVAVQPEQRAATE